MTAPQKYITLIKGPDGLTDPQVERSMDDVQHRATMVEQVTEGRMRVLYLPLDDFETFGHVAMPGAKKEEAA